MKNSNYVTRLAQTFDLRRILALRESRGTGSARLGDRIDPFEPQAAHLEQATQFLGTPDLSFPPQRTHHRAQVAPVSFDCDEGALRLQERRDLNQQGP